MTRFLFFLALFIVSSLSNFSEAQTGMQDVSDRISWISAGNSVAAHMPVFRKTFRLEKSPSQAILTATALGVYDVEINGVRVGNDELKPGWTDYRKEVLAQKSDVSHLLHKGMNEICVQMSRGWWNGDISRKTYGKNPALEFAAFMDLDGFPFVITDESWECALDGPLIDGDIYNGERYDARLAPRQWMPATIIGRSDVAVLVYDANPVRIRDHSLWRIPESITIYSDTVANGFRYGMISPKAVLGNVPFTLRKGEKAVVDLGQNMVGWINFKAKAKKGTEMTFRHGEMLNFNGDKDGRLDDGPGGSVWSYNLRSAKARVCYTFNGDRRGESWHPRHTFMGFRYVEISASDDVEIMNIEGQPVGSDMIEWGDFECSDKDVNKLYSNIRWGQRGNFLSVPTDCPQRDERLGWTGDTQIFCKTALYNSDASEFYRKWMRDMRNSQREDGAYPDIAPFPNFWGYGTAAWGDAGIIVPWTVYEMTGKKDILEENIESMERWMQWLGQQSDSAISKTNPTDTVRWNHCGAGTHTGDWLAYAPLDPRIVSMAYYAYTSDIMAKTCDVLGRPDDAARYANTGDEVRAEFRKRYLDVDGTLQSDTQTAYLLAFRMNLLPDSCVQAAKDRLRKNIEDNGYKLNTGFVGTALLCPVLSDCGMDDLAYSLLLQHDNPSWLYSIDQGATTVWERWDSYTVEEGFHKHHWNMNSFNHYAYGVIAEWMYEYMGGIRPGSPGFGKVILSPHVDNRPDGHPSLKSQKRIDWAKVKTCTPNGDISSEWRRTPDGHYEFDFILPAGLDYDIDIPGLTDKDIVNVRRL